MFAYTRLVEGLLVAHLLIVIAYLLGSNATAWAMRRSASSAEAMIRLVCTCALGFALLGFGAFFIASIHLFVPIAAVAMVLALFFGGCALARATPFSWSFWAERWQLVVDAVDAPHVITYFCLLVVAFPAVNLANAGSDALAYHWAYAVDFVTHHGFVVDPFLRWVFYAQNDLMIVALVMLFGGYAQLQFVMWMLGLLTGLGIAAGARDAFGGRGFWPAVIGTLLAVATIYSPFYLRWMDSGFLDVSLGFFALASILALREAMRESGPDWRWLAASAAIAAFLIGSKASLLPFTFVYAGVFAVALRRLGCTRAQCLVVLGLLVALASPWYLRNLVLAGDPIAPWLNLKLHGSDGLVKSGEWQHIVDDLTTDKSPVAIATIPWRIFFTPDTPPFREFATNGIMLLLFVPTIVLFVGVFVMRRKISPTVSFPIVLLSVMIAYWIASATYARYALLYYPSLALCCALIAGQTRYPIARAGPIFAALCALAFAITPTGEGSAFYTGFFVNGVQNPPLYYTADEPHLAADVRGYAEERFVASIRRRLGVGGRVYVLSENLGYYYRRDGITSIGDWVGPAGFFRFYHAAASGQTVEFVDALDARAVVLDPDRSLLGLDVPIGRALERDGFCRIPLPSSQMSLFIRAHVPCADARRIAAAPAEVE